jgi:hypothetical protein
MTTEELLAVLEDHGLLLESARGPVPSVAELVVGAPITGSWWAHPDSHAIFDAINTVADHRYVVRTRLLKGKVTLVHRRLWPVLVVLADRFPPERLAALHERHTDGGRHVVDEEPFPDWVPEDAVAAAAGLTVDAAEALLPPALAGPRAQGAT